MKNKKHIAMRCNQEQFEAIKPNLKANIKFNSVTDFKEYNYLVNCDSNMISNICKSELFTHVWKNVEEIHEQWNEKIFLEACGIETIPTLEEVKEYFKDAETIESLSGRSFKNYNIFRYSKYGIDGDTSIYTENGSFEVWNSKKGYAKILTYKTPKFEITKETVIKYQMKEEFPEVFEVKLEVGKWYKRIWKSNGDVDLFPIYDICKKGDIDDKGNYFRNGNIIKSSFNVNISTLKDNRVIVSEATPEEVTEALKKEAVRRGYKTGVWIVDIYNGKTKEDIIQVSSDYFDYEKIMAGINQGKMALRDSDGSIIFFNGTWATVIKTKTIQQAEELLKELGHEIKIV